MSQDPAAPLSHNLSARAPAWGTFKKGKMKTLATILLLTIALATARADVAVYKLKVKSTKTGGGSVLRATTGGFIVFDPQTLELANVQVYDSLFQFKIPVMNFNVINSVSPAPGQTWTVIAVDADGVGGTTAKGKDVSLDLGGVAGLYQLPKVFKFTTSDSTASVGVVKFLVEEKGVLIFDQTDTQAANVGGYNVAQTVESIRQTLLASGYQEQ